MDVIRWSDDINLLMREALRPAVPQNVVFDAANRTIHLEIEEKDFATVLGRKGQNARLTSRLLGWQLDIERLQHADVGFEEKKVRAMQVLSQIPSITPNIASTLVDMGITSLDAFEGVTENDLVESGIPEEISQQIIQDAKHLLGQ